MKAIIKKGDTVIKLAESLTVTLSRPLKKKMVMLFLTPDQDKKRQEKHCSDLQLRTIWMVCGDLFKNVGGKTTGEYYFEFKREYLAHKIKADDSEYAGMIEDFESMKLVMNEKKWLKMADRIYSHKDGSIKQFHNAFDEFCVVHASRGDQFRHPDEFRAMQQTEFYKDLIK